MWYWFQLDCLSAAGPLDASMRFVYIQIKQQMGSLEENYRTELRFISQGPSLSMSDDIYKDLDSLWLSLRLKETIACPRVAFITVVAEKSCLVSAEFQASRMKWVGPNFKILLLFLSRCPYWCCYCWKLDMQYQSNTILLAGCCLYLPMLFLKTIIYHEKWYVKDGYIRNTAALKQLKMLVGKRNP